MRGTAHIHELALLRHELKTSSEWVFSEEVR
jgi:hypothetical protein